MSSNPLEQSAVARAIADLEAVDTALGALASSQLPTKDGSSTGGPLAEARALLRAAIASLSAAQKAGDDAVTAKRRVKIKAASDAPPVPADPARAQTPARPAETGKSAARNGTRRSERAQSRPAPPQIPKAPAGSLLARLGAAAAMTPASTQSTSIGPSQPPPDPPSAVPAGEVKGITAEDAVNRLARLEAEIASLTDPAPGSSPKAGDRRATAAPTKPPTSPSNASPKAATRPSPPAPSRADVTPGEDDEAEVEIVGADRPAGGHVAASGRKTPRVYRDAAVPDEDDEAEVEIVGAGEEGREPGGAMGSAVERGRSRAATAKGTAAGRWRLFRGSS